MPPLVSIVTPNYNHSKYLSDYFDGILAQTELDLEVIVIDDCSTDNSVEILRAYEKQIPNLRVYQNEKNRGPIPTTNWGISLAQGKYLNFCAADDCLLPGFCKKLIAVLEAHPEMALCCSMPCFFKGAHLKESELIIEQRFKQPLCLNPKKFWELTHHQGFWIAGHTSLYRKDLLLSYGCFPENLKHLSDSILHYKIASYHLIGYLAEPLAAMRSVEHSYSTQKLNKEFFLNLIRYVENKKYSYFANEFRKFGGLRCLGYRVVILLLKNPAYWKYLPPLIKKYGWQFLKKKLNQLFCKKN